MNQYYSAVAQSGALSWKAMLFASPDPTALTATDKPPLSFWPMSLSARVFGVHPWSIALPQVLETLATLVLLYLAVRLLGGRLAAAAAAVVFATTPVVLVLARFDDPDTLLTLLLTAAAYVTVRAARSPRRRWVVLLGVLLGLAFLTKWLVAVVPAPALVATLLRARTAPSRGSGRAGARWGWLRGDSGRTLALLSAVAAGTGLSWVAAVLLTPASARPYPDSPTGSIVDIVLGQNGFGRLDGSGSALSGTPGPFRLLLAPMADQIGWLLPAAALAVVVAVARARRAGPLSDGYLLFGGWLVLTAGTFSVIGGAMHAYYTVLLAPALAALVGLGAADLHRRRTLTAPAWPVRIALALGLGALGWYAASILSPYPTLRPWRWAIALAVGVSLAALATSWAARTPGPRSSAARALAAAAAAVALLIGPTTLSVSTLAHPVGGADPLAGPVETGDGHAPYTPGLLAYLAAHDGPQARWAAAVVTSTPAAELQLQTGLPVLAFGGFTGHSGFPALAQVQGWVASGRLRFVVLAGPYTGNHGTVPRGMRGTATAQVMTWAMSHGRLVSVPGSGYAVLDLAPGPAGTAG